MVWPFKWKLLRAVLSWGTVYYVVQGGSHFWVCGWNPMVWPQIKATEQYFPVVVVITLYKVILTFESVNEILWCDHSNESYWAVLYCGTVYYAVQCGSKFWVCELNPMEWPLKCKLLSSTFLGYCLLCSTRWFSLLSLWMKTCDVPFKHKLLSSTFAGYHLL